MPRKTLREARSQRPFGASALRSFGHRSRALQMGYAREDFLNKPVVAIINTWSDLAQCHGHFPDRVGGLKRGHTEGLLRTPPVGGAVLMGGCDKTTPGTIMGAISMNLPVIFMPAGPMMRG